MEWDGPELKEVDDRILVDLLYGCMWTFFF
jgi:hypothetical protein